MKVRVSKTNNGITLIALVITIIVLLILAGVTIATLMGDNGILTKANEAKKQNEIAEVKERAQLDIVSWVSDKMENGEDSTVNTPEKVKEILDEINPDENNRYYKECTSNGVETPNGYIVSYEELYTDNIKAGTEVTDIPKDWTSNKVIAIADGEGGVIPLPNNFYYVGGTKSEGIVISDNSADEGMGTSHEVAQTLVGNQFVWIPVEDDSLFQRYEGYQSGSLQSFVLSCSEPYASGYSTETEEYQAMYNSVLAHDGFYVGRYEAGTTNSSRSSSSGISDAVVVRQGQHVYDYVGWSNSDDMTNELGGAVELSKNFDTVNGYTSVTSTLIYGVQWDAIMNYIDPAYATGNCDTSTSFVANSRGKGYYDQSTPTTTGSSGEYAVKNIYDLGGNVVEWTMEAYNTGTRVYRGRSLHFFWFG